MKNKFDGSQPGAKDAWTFERKLLPPEEKPKNLRLVSPLSPEAQGEHDAFVKGVLSYYEDVGPAVFFQEANSETKRALWGGLIGENPENIENRQAFFKFLEAEYRPSMGKSDPQNSTPWLAELKKHMISGSILPFMDSLELATKYLEEYWAREYGTGVLKKNELA